MEPFLKGREIEVEANDTHHVTGNGLAGVSHYSRDITSLHPHAGNAHTRLTGLWIVAMAPRALLEANNADQDCSLLLHGLMAQFALSLLPH